MASLVTKTVGGPSADYKTWKEFCAANVNLVAADEYWEVTVAPGVHLGGWLISGWTLDATRYLHIKGTNAIAKAGSVPGTNSTDTHITAQNTNIGTGQAIDIVNNGVGALIIFEDISISEWRDSDAIDIHGANATTVRFIRCNAINMGNTTRFTVYTAGGAHLVQMINCYVEGEKTAITRGSGDLQLYNCTVKSRTTYAIDMAAASSSSLLYNCYFACTGSAAAIQNIGAATVTNCATHDATGTAGLQNITWSHTNFRSLSRRWGDAKIMPGSSLLNAGATLVGLPGAIAYTDDIHGLARVMATPEIGCCEFDGTESPIAITRTVEPGSWDEDYVSLNAFGSLNLNLVALDQAFTIQYGLSSSTDNVACTFDGWTTDATRSITVRNLIDDGVRYHCEHWGFYYTGLPQYTGRLALAGALVLDVGSIGASGLLVIEGIPISTNNVSGKAVQLNANASGGTLRLIGCRVSAAGATAGTAIEILAGAATTEVQLLNCWLLSGGCSAVRNASASVVVKAYHCTASRVSAVAGVNGNTFDMNNVAGSELVNCFAHNNFGAGSCYANLTNVTFTKCGSTDATGSETSLQSMTYSDAEFWRYSLSAPVPIPLETSAVIGVGADLSGASAPFNLDYDANWVPRGSSPSLGAFDVWTTLSSSWTPSQTGVNTTKARNFSKFSTYGGKLYAGTEFNPGQVGEVYETADGVNWANAGFSTAAGTQVGGLAELGGKLYCLHTDLLKVEEYNGVAWGNVAANYLGGAAGNPAYPGAFVNHNDGSGEKLYCGHGNVNNNPIHSSADGATWTTEGAGFESRNCYGLVSTGTTLIAQCTYGNYAVKGGTTWYDGAAYIYPTSAMTGQPGLFATGTEIYAITNDVTHSALWHVFKFDLSTWRWVLKSTLERQATTLKQGFVAGGSVYAMGIQMVGGTNVGHAPMVSRDDGAHWTIGKVMAVVPSNSDSYPSSSDGSFNETSAIFAGRMFVGAGYGTQDALAYYSDLIFNALELDDVDYESGEYRKNNFTASICMKADTISDHPYSRLTLQTQDYTSDTYSKLERDWSARFIRNYYTIPPANFWQWYRATGQRDADEPYVLEDAIRYFIRIYKENQIQWLQGPMLTVDSTDENLVPVAYVPTGETKAADSMAWSNVCMFDNFSMKLRWNPTCCHTDFNQTTEMFKIESGADWIKLEVLGARTPEREYNLNDIYGPHEPQWRFSKGNGTTTEFSKTFVLYHSYGGTDASNEWMLHDVIEFEILNYAGQLSSCRIFKGGVEGYVSSNGPIASGVTSQGTLTINGPGVWGSPKVCNIRTATRETTNPDRTMLANRLGVPRRMTGAGRSPILSGERDPNAGIINPDYSNAYLEIEDFNRANSGNLGSDWWTEEESGPGWVIDTNRADCAVLGWERWDDTPKHRDHIIRCEVTSNDTGSKVGVFGRYERYRDGHTCYLARMVESGAAAATLEIVRVWEGTEEVLVSDAFDKYATGDTYHAYLKFTGTTIYSRFDTVPQTIYTPNGTDTLFAGAVVTDTPITPFRAVLTWYYNGTKYEISDDGAGVFNPGVATVGGLDSATIDYATGSISCTYTFPPDGAGALIQVYQSMAVATTTDTFIRKPGRVGIYGLTTGAGNHVQIDNFYCERNHNVGVN